MKSTITFSLLLLLFVGFVPVYFASAACPPDCGEAGGAGADRGEAGGAGADRGEAGGAGVDRGGGGGGGVGLVNPLGDKTLAQFARDIIEVLLIFITPIIILAYIFAGFKYVMSRGNPEEIKKASMWLLYISIGALLALGSFIILEVIEGTVNAFRSNV